MSMSAEVQVEGERTVVVKRVAAAAATSLRLEGERLERSSHPGVVQVVRSAARADGWELCTAHAGRPLSIVGPLTVAEVAGLVAALASTLADLHQLGVAHGRVDPSHVLVGEHGRPVLCGFGDGTTPMSPEDDVAALGDLLVELLGSEGDDGEPIPERRWRGRRSWSGWERRALLLLADQACAEPATRRPNARRLAASIAEAVPTLVRPSDRPVVIDVDARRSPADAVLDPIQSLRSSRLVDVGDRTLRPSALALGVIGALLLVAGIVRWRGGGGGETTIPGSTPSPSAAATAEPAPDPQVHTAAPVAHSQLEVEGRRYRVGQTGDELLVEDWDCDGTPTPALLRPDTGEVYVFERWIESDRVAVDPVLVVQGATELVSEVAPGGCPSLAVRAPSGDLVPVLEGLR